MTKMIGLLLAVLGSLLPVGAALMLTLNPYCLVGLLVTIWITIGMLNLSKDQLMRGFLILLLGIFLMIMVYFIGMWALPGMIIMIPVAPKYW